LGLSRFLALKTNQEFSNFQVFSPLQNLGILENFQANEYFFGISFGDEHNLYFVYSINAFFTMFN
jgi:hypothetical protein